jgi:hypothetical protein
MIEMIQLDCDNLEESTDCSIEQSVSNKGRKQREMQHEMGNGKMKRLSNGNRILCKIDPSLRCISASINTSKAYVVALTTLNSVVSSNSSGNSNGLYETFLIQLLDYTNHFGQKQPISFRKSPYFHQIQFLNENSFLLFCEMEGKGNLPLFRIELYKFQLNPKTGQLLTYPKLHAMICQYCVWYQWDPDKSYLYYLALTQDNTFQLFISRCIITEGIIAEPIHIYNVPIKESDGYSDPNHHCTNSKHLNSQYETCLHTCHQQSLMRAYYKGTDYCIISLDNDVNCLCRQIFYVGSQNRKFIMVQIYVLSHQQTISFAIPITKSNTYRRAFFGRQNNILIVFVPEEFLKLIMININEQPANLVTLSAPQDSTQLISNLADICKNVPEGDANLIPIFTNQANDFYALNLSNGDIYKYNINCDILLHIMKENVARSNKIDRTLPILHWSIIYQPKHKKRSDGSTFYDFSIAERMIQILYRHNKICSHERLENTYLFKEFILATSYMIASDIFKMEKEFLLMIPKSILSSYYNNSNNNNNKESSLYLLAQVGKNYMCNQDDNCLPLIAPQIQQSELILKNPYEIGSDDPPKGIPIVKTLWQFIGNRSDQQSSSFRSSSLGQIEFEKQLKKKQDDVSDDFISLYCRFAYCVYMKNILVNSRNVKNWLAKKWATAYTLIISDQVSRLFYLIQSACSAAIRSLDPSCEKFKEPPIAERKWYFELLVLFHRSLEEIGLPPPPHFHYEFSLIAFYVLPRRSFLQYVKRKVFLITKPFIDYIFNNNLCKDASLFNILLQYMVRSPNSMITTGSNATNAITGNNNSNNIQDRSTNLSLDGQIQSEIHYIECDMRYKHLLVSYYHSLAFQDKMLIDRMSTTYEGIMRRNSENQLQSLEKNMEEDDTISWDSHSILSPNLSDANSEHEFVSETTSNKHAPVISLINNSFNDSCSSHSVSSTDSSPNMVKNQQKPSSFSIGQASSFNLFGSGSYSSYKIQYQQQLQQQRLTERRKLFIQVHGNNLLQKYAPHLIIQ